MSHWLSAPEVAIERVEASYPAVPPFHPGQAYPEYRWPELGDANHAYDGVRGALALLHLDAGRLGTAAWNPLSELIKPGDTVLVKPNLIREGHVLKPDEWQQVITHGAVIRAVLDYVFLALGSTGSVVLADGPQTDSDFDAIGRRLGLAELVGFYRRHGLTLNVLDLRRELWHQRGDVIERRTPLPGDPAGYTTVELGDASSFSTYQLSGRYYGADYDIAETSRFHNAHRHAYVLCRTAMDADVVINLPKLKTHKKTGVTLSLKNLVGVNGYRNCLPHHTLGTPTEGGDEFPVSDVRHRLESRMTATFKRVLARLGGGAGAWARWIKHAGRLVFGDTQRVVRSGNWHGNDTAWRMVLDLNKCLFHFDGTGARRRSPLRYITLVDGIVAGQGNGPLAPDAVPAGLIVAGWNPVAVDTVCTTLMGFEHLHIPLLEAAWSERRLPLQDFSLEAIRCRSNLSAWNGSLDDLRTSPDLAMQPHFGWCGKIERAPRTGATAVAR